MKLLTRFWMWRNDYCPKHFVRLASNKMGGERNYCDQCYCEELERGRQKAALNDLHVREVV
jgi:hypothetical protein